MDNPKLWADMELQIKVVVLEDRQDLETLNWMFLLGWIGEDPSHVSVGFRIGRDKYNT